ncbi:MAG: tryptophan synthase subunit beta, partial [Candidatus Omnitrophica bacterium]|nr:tryptophan synthase subunit beta [Candidatus Omnitrophota bacterium]
AGKGVHTKQHAAALMKGSVGVLHGMKSFVLQNNDGQIQLAHSISAGLDYPGVGPEHSYLKESGRVRYVAVSDKEALRGFKLLIDTEGIIPALEPSHALFYLTKLAPRLAKTKSIIVCLSGRGDKDMPIIRQHIKM